MKKLFLAGVAALFLATGTAHAQNGCYYQFCSVTGYCRQVCKPTAIQVQVSTAAQDFATIYSKIYSYYRLCENSSGNMPDKLATFLIYGLDMHIRRVGEAIVASYVRQVADESEEEFQKLGASTWCEATKNLLIDPTIKALKG